MTLFPTLALLYFTIIFFAGEPIWVYSSAELFILVVSFVLLLVFTLRSKPAGKTPLKIYKDPVTTFGFLFLLLICFQMIPWPPNLVKVLSPMSLTVWNGAPLPEGSFFPVSVYPYATKQGLIFAFCLLLVYWWVLYGIKDRRGMERLALGMLVFGALMAFYGLMETATGHDQILWWKKVYGQGTVTATFFNRNHLATFLSMNLLIGIGYFWSLWSSTQKGDETGKIKTTRQIEKRIKNLGLKGLLTGLSLLILIFTLLSTASRGGNLSTLAGLILIGGLIRTRSAHKRGVASFFLLIMVIVAFGAYAVGDQLWERLKQEPFEKIEATPSLNRPALIKDTWAMVRDYPSLGSGFNTYPYVFTRYAEHSLKYMDHAHNDWLELAAESGGAGLLIILSGLFLGAFRLLKPVEGNPDPLASGLKMGGMGVLLAVSLHSLTDFSLHKPANAFLLAAILGLTFRAVYRRDKLPLKDQIGVSPRSGPTRMTTGEVVIKKKNGLFFSGKKNGVFFALFIMLGGSVGLWGANAVVRSFLMNLWIPADSDVTGQRPDPGLEEEIKAISINPDHSAGWVWLSQTLQSEKKLIPDTLLRTLMENGKSRWAKEKPGLPVQEYQILFPVLEALSRRPVAPHYWYRLVFASRDFLDHNPSFYTPLIAGAYDNILFFDPQSAVGYLERGTFCLQHGQYFSEKHRGDCLDDLKKSLELDPGLSPRIIEELANRSFPLKILMDILPKDNAFAWISAGETLLNRNQLTLGETIYLKGEQLKVKETEALIVRIKNQLHEKRRTQLENLIRELIDLDPDHPLIGYVRGDILRACEQAHKRGWPLGRLDEITRLHSILKSLKPGNDPDRLMPRFYLALLDLEGKNYKEAARGLDMVLEEKPNFYPALLAWEQTADQLSKPEDGKILLEKIQKKISLFSMDEIPAGAWVAADRHEENEPKRYRAVLRNEKPLSELKITAPIEAERWMVFVDARFVAARETQGKAQTINLPDPIVPGEHQVIIKSLQIDKEIKSH
jgi:tetratricopeptide (TPR) repeat protein